MLYSKFGSIPKTDIDSTDGWVEVGYPPNPVAEGYECVWWFPPGWVVRPIKPNTDDDWSWDQSLGQWVTPQNAQALSTGQLNSLASIPINEA